MKLRSVVKSITGLFSTMLKMHDESERVFRESIAHLDDKSKAALIALRRAPR